MKKDNKKLLIKLMVSICLVIVIFLKINLKDFTEILLSTNLFFFYLSFLLFLLQQVMAVYCWAILLQTQYRQLHFFKILEAYMIGNFFGTFVPSSVGIDFFRAFNLAKYLQRGVDAISSIFVLRIINLLALLLLAIGAAIPISRVTRHASILWLTSGMFLCLIIGIVSIFNRSAKSAIKRGLERLRARQIKEKTEEVYRSLIAFSGQKAALIQVFSLSIIFQVVGILFVYLAGLSLGIKVPLEYYFIYIPIIMIIALIPVSLAGIGVREGSFIYFFSQVGASKPEALSLSLLIFFQMICMAVSGGILYLLSSFPIKRKSRNIFSNNF